MKEFYFPIDGQNKGQVKNPELHGKGTLTLPGGRKYVGDFSHGKPNGDGMPATPEGIQCGRNRRDGVLTGWATCSFVNGDCYEGQLRDGRPNGLGTFRWESGKKYEGNWKNGVFHGEGTLIYPNGTKLVGEFNDGAYVGNKGLRDYVWAKGELQ